MARRASRTSALLLLVALGAPALAAGCGSEDGGKAEGEGTGGAATSSPDGGSDQASGGSGAVTARDGGSGGDAVEDPGSCTAVLGKCSASSLPCCSGTECVAGQCRATCNDHAECGSRCCAHDAEAGMKLCSDIAECPDLGCLKEGTDCASAADPCCDALICVEAEQASWGGCRKPCAADGECASGCCVPFANVSGGFCADARFCVCATLDEPCGGATRCCDGLACSTYDSTGAFGCRPLCSNNGECDTKCCKRIVGTQDSVCVEAGFCAP